MAITDTWVKVGNTLDSGEFWYHDEAAWMRWTMRVVEQIDERGAWFIVGIDASDDRLVFDVLEQSYRLRLLLHERNIRRVEYWRGHS